MIMWGLQSSLVKRRDVSILYSKNVLYIKYTHHLFYSPTEAAFHRTVYEFKKQGMEQQKEDGLEELTTANFPSHDPDKPIGMSLVTSNLSHVRSSLSIFSIPFSTIHHN